MSVSTLEQYLKELRKSYNYSQEFVASQLNITRQTYSHYETGRIMPPVNSLYNLSKLYNVPVESFLALSASVAHHTASGAKHLSAEPDENKWTEADDIKKFLEYINTPENSRKFQSLRHQEKLFLYYYQLLDDRDREDILSFMKVKYHNRKRPMHG